MYLFTNKTHNIDRFIEATGANNLDYLIITNEEQDFINLNGGSFPFFLYYKDSTFIYQWSAGEFGYRALDWLPRAF